jgi:hypothetical protein
MEWGIDTRQRDRSEATHEVDIACNPWLLKYVVIAAVHDVLQHLLDLHDTRYLSQLTGYYQFNNS